MGTLDNLRRLADVDGDSVRRVIRAYHGSPHDFDRFDAGKIGTGEGAQAFGYGLYFADNPAVAESYRSVDRMPTAEEAERLEFLSALGERLRAKQKEIDSQLEKIAMSSSSIAPGWGDIRDIPDTAEARKLNAQKLSNKLSIDEADIEVAAIYNSLRRGGKGHAYEVEIGYPEASLLDYDAPISHQPEAVTAFLRSQRFEEQPPTGRDLVSDLIYELAGKKTTLPYRDMERLASKEASGMLMDAGIPGIRYLDGNSRLAGEGTRNYVMFPGTEDKIRILRKYGLLPATFAAEGLVNPQQPAESTAPAF